MDREFITLINYIDNEYNTNHPPGETLEHEFVWLQQSGLSLKNWALVDHDVKWERYLRYLVIWAIEHNSDAFEGLSPACYQEWSELYD